MPLSVGLALTISLSSALNVMLDEVYDEANYKEDVEYVDILAFAKGETLSVDLGLRDMPNSDKLLRVNEHTGNLVLRSGVNISQLEKRNTRTQKMESRSKKNMRNFIDKLPKIAEIAEVKGFEGYFSNKSKDQAEQSVDELLAYAKSYRGTPYRWGGMSERGFDCSGFTQNAFRHVGIELPRTSHSQAQLGKTVTMAEAQPGDMVFFGRKRRHGYRTSHTGIVTANRDGQLRIIHSSSRGIVEEDILSVQSYQRRFLFIKRIL